ncbi:MAG TPA: YHS domain-containing protein, partial [Candidatus Acidoferrum sp.]|nr:YHS domain-containing protein [Candidatus Acidoferrum sp.]
MERTERTAKIAKDPVCGMTVDPAKAAATVEYEGRPYHFCSKGCAAKFQLDPQKFLARAANSTSASQHAHHHQPPTEIAGPTPSARSMPAVTDAQSKHAVAAPTRRPNTTAPAEAGEGVRYTCPMHPQIVQIGP